LQAARHSGAGRCETDFGICAWVRGRFSQPISAPGVFAPLIEIMVLSSLQKHSGLTGTLVEEKRDRYRCD
jgi:hypothetical protein